MHIITVGDAQDLASIFLIAFFTEIGIPFPLVLDTVFFLLGYHIEDLWPRAITLIFILFVARETGASIIFWVSHYLGHPLINWLGRRFPSILGNLDKIATRLGVKTSFAVAVSRLSAQVPLAASAFSFRAPFTIALSRITPGLLTVTSIASGTLRFRYTYFVLGIGMASVFSDSTVILMGTITGYGLRQLSLAPPPWLLIIGIIINLVVVLAVQRMIWRHAAKN